MILKTTADFNNIWLRFWHGYNPIGTKITTCYSQHIQGKCKSARRRGGSR